MKERLRQGSIAESVKHSVDQENPEEPYREGQTRKQPIDRWGNEVPSLRKQSNLWDWMLKIQVNRA
jgi:hypothetical protein